MKTPKFWNTNNLISQLLTPISYIYNYITQWRINHATPYHSTAKVICVGNITAGGVGKTPVAIALAKQYQKEGKKVFFLTRGYKGKLKNIIVDLNLHTAKETGDEARLLAQTAPTIIAPNREYGAKLAEKQGAEIIIMDDGFQNPQLYKDESWLVFDGNIGIGNGKILPAGPLRESLKTGQSRANYILIMGKDNTNLKSQCILPIRFGVITPEPFTLENKNVLAFAGIGHPEKFYQTLTELGYPPVITKDYKDHHSYTITDIKELTTLAKHHNLSLVTTEKDYVKLPKELSQNIHTLKITAKIINE